MNNRENLSSWDLTQIVRQKAGVFQDATPPPIGACTVEVKGPNLHYDNRFRQWVSSSVNQLPSDICTNKCGDGFKWVMDVKTCEIAPKVDTITWQNSAAATTTAIAEKPTSVVATVLARRTVFAQQALDRKATRVAKAASKNSQPITLEETPQPQATQIPEVIVKTGDTTVSSNTSSNSAPRNEVGKSITGDIATIYKNTSPVVQYGLPILGTLVVGAGAMYGVSRFIRSRIK